MSYSSEGWTLPSLGEMPDEPLWYDGHDRNSYFRIIPRGGDPLWFNPNTSTEPADPLNGGRFHPFDSTAGGRVPTLYAASSLKAAISESPLLQGPAGAAGPLAASVSAHRGSSYQCAGSGF